MMAICCLGCGKGDNGVTEEPVINDPEPVATDPQTKPIEVYEPKEEPVVTRHSYTPVILNETQQAINIKLQDFSWKLFEEVYTHRKSGINLMVSPISLEVDLAMFINGLEGETLKEVLKTLGLENYTKAQINDFFQTMMTGIEKADEAAIFKSANSFWYNQRKTANKDFLTAIQENFAAKTEAVNFGDPQTKDFINYWCAEQTNNRIPKMVDSTDDFDLFHLMNAVYFKADWEKEFKKDLTTKQPFYYADSKTEEIDMMFENTISTYVESPNLQVTFKPFVDGSFQLVLILPKEGAKMEDVITDVKNFSLSLLTPTDTNVSSRWAEINLYVPKFTSEYTEENLFEYMANINPTLKFAANDMKFFDDALVDIDTSCLQKTFFLMDEKGAEAAAITDIMVKNTSVGPGPEPIVLRFDRPFFYAIVESQTSCPLFIGYYGR